MIAPLRFPTMVPPTPPLPLIIVPLSPPPPPTAIIRFAGKVTLLSSLATLMGVVNAGVVVVAAPYACDENVPLLLGIPTHVAGTGGVAVE